jgi:hypothetical protein
MGQASWAGDLGCPQGPQAQKGPVLAVMLCTCHLEILGKFLIRVWLFHFALGSTNDAAGSGRRGFQPGFPVAGFIPLSWIPHLPPSGLCQEGGKTSAEGLEPVI